MLTILSRFIHTDSPELRQEFEKAWADRIDSLYEQYRYEKAFQTLKEKKPQVLSTPLSSLDIPARTVTALARAHIVTVYDVLHYSEEQLASGYGMSPKAAGAVFAAVDELLA